MNIRCALYSVIAYAILFARSDGAYCLVLSVSVSRLLEHNQFLVKCILLADITVNPAAVSITSTDEVYLHTYIYGKINLCTVQDINFPLNTRTFQGVSQISRHQVVILVSTIKIDSNTSFAALNVSIGYLLVN